MVPDPVGAQQADRLVSHACVVIRAALLAQFCLAVLVEGRGFHSVQGLLIVAAVAESAWLAWVLLTRPGRPRPMVAVADVAFGVAALVFGAWSAPPNASHFWGNAMYPFTLVSSGAVLAAMCATMRGTMAASTTLAFAYGAGMAWFHEMDPAYAVNISIDMLTYVPFAWVARWLGTEAGALGARLDVMQEEAVRKAEQLTQAREQARHEQEVAALRLTATETALAAERERLENMASLHDRVLQTMETLAREGVLPDPRLRSHVAVEARWLRRLIEEGGRREDGSLSDRLWSVAEEFERLGLRVEFSARGPAVAIAEPCVHALTEAAREALNNVAKHAGAAYAVMRAVVERDRVLVTVVDTGRGFDPDAVPWGTGLTDSVKTRLATVNGGLLIESAPGEGTRVELWVPT